jgi:hypothetical protein
MGLIACHYRAAEWRHKEIELAAHELLQYLTERPADDAAAPRASAPLAHQLQTSPKVRSAGGRGSDPRGSGSRTGEAQTQPHRRPLAPGRSVLC